MLRELAILYTPITFSYQTGFCVEECRDWGLSPAAKLLLKQNCDTKPRMKSFPVRKHPRLPIPVYQEGHIFFITCTTYSRFRWFERYRIMATTAVELLESLASERGTDIFAWCMMPDHCHLLIRDSNTIDFVRLFKGRLTPVARKLNSRVRNFGRKASMTMP